MGLIKKKILKEVASWTGLIAVSIGLGSGISYTLSDCGYTSADYAEDKQIEYYMEELDCDSRYFKNFDGDFARFAHNDGEPIPVAFEDGYDERVKEVAIKSLDYTFGIMQDINPLYNYKLVSEKEFKKKGIGTNGIKYSIKNQKEMVGLDTIAQANSTEVTKGKNRIIDGEIFYCEERIEGAKENEIYYSMVHEILHLMGFEDLYFDTKVNPNNTVMHNSLMFVEANKDDKYGHANISPNDYNLLLAVYSPRCESQNEMDDMLKEVKEKSKIYQEKFYGDVADNIKSDELYKEYEFGDCSNIENWKLTYTYKPNDEPNVYSEIEIKGQEYKLSYWADEGVFKDKVVCAGKVLKYNECIVLKDVKLNKSITYVDYLPYIGDWVIVKQESYINWAIIKDSYNTYFGLYRQIEITKNHDKELETTSVKKIDQPANIKVPNMPGNGIEYKDEEELSL